MDASFPQSFFQSAKFLLTGVVNGTLREGIEGVAAVFLARHYLELALKYTLFHSRWLKDETHNATDVQPVVRGHDLQKLWDMLTKELKSKPTVVPKGLDLDFVARFIEEFHAYDPYNWRFRYPGTQIAVADSSQHSDRPQREALGIGFASLLSNLHHANDLLDTLDTYLIETYGENEDWQEEQNSW